VRLDLDLKKMKAAASDGAVNGFMVKSLADCHGYSNPKIDSIGKTADGIVFDRRH